MVKKDTLHKAKTSNPKQDQSLAEQVPEEKKIFRIIFYVLAALAFVLMPVLSLDSGLSGDEKSSYVHSSRVYDYFAHGDTACLNTQGDPLTQNLEYYGQGFDNVTYLFIKWFNIDNPYEFRHCCNALLGWCIAFIVALFLAKISGYRAAIFGFLMILLSPRFLGHSFNNPKDIPFALGYVLAIYQMMLLVKELPKTKIKRLVYIALGIALANSIRIGGLMLVAYLMLFCGVWYFFENKEHKYNQKEFWGKGLILLAKLVLVSIVGYFVSIILWPYMQQSPIAHAKDALQLMEHYSVNLRQVFEGVNIWSTNAPWYYLPKYIFMSIPEVVIFGLIVFLIFIKKIVRNQSPMAIFIVLFSFLFPILYIIVKASNVYGGWRHVLFTYPFLVIAAALGWNAFYHFFKTKMQPFVYVLFGLLILFPLIHIVKSHPHEYVYYNFLSGGVAKNYGFYEMDYYQHSTKAASKWLDNYLIENKLKGTGKEKIKIASNDHKAIEYYFRKDSAQYYDISYIRYYERGNSDWDYAISINTYINADQLQKAIWPPKGTIHTIDVGGKPIAAIIKRENKDDYYGYLLKAQLSNQDLPMEERIALTHQAIGKYRQAYDYDPNNESAILALIELYSGTRHTDSTLFFVNRLVEVCPSENFLSYAINIYTRVYEVTKDQGMLTAVMRLHQQLITKYPYSASNYYNAAMFYLQIGNKKKGLTLMETCMEKSGRGFEANYYNAIFTAQSGDGAKAIELLEITAKKFPEHDADCQSVINQIRGIDVNR